MKKISILSIFLALGMIMALVLPVGAVQGVPYGVTGTVTLDDAPVAAGTIVSAWIYGYKCAEATVTSIPPNMSYVLPIITQDPDDPNNLHCGANGDTVAFRIGAIVADQTGTFVSGNSPLDTINLSHTGNSAPMADGQAIVVSQFASASITLTGSDFEGDAFTFSNVSPLPGLGTITGSGASRIYTPNDPYDIFSFARNFGNDIFNFRAVQPSPGPLAGPIARVYITVDDPPTDIILSDPYVGSGQPVNTVVGTLNSTQRNVSDFNTQKIFKYSLVSGAGGTDNASFNIYPSAGVWSLRTSAALVAGQTYSVRIRSIDNFGLSLDKIFAIHAVDPTSVNLMSFTAKVEKKAASAGSRSVALNWQAASEANNLGFNLYRAASADGVKTKLNAALIPAQLSVTGAASASYSYTDSGLKNKTTYYYWLESVDNRGATSLAGPVLVRLVGGKTR
jgi:hypothetical protein